MLLQRYLDEFQNVTYVVHSANSGQMNLIIDDVIKSCSQVLLVSCPARTRLPARNGLVNKVEFLGLIPQKW